MSGKDWKRAQADTDACDDYTQIECRNKDMITGIKKSMIKRELEHTKANYFSKFINN